MLLLLLLLWLTWGCGLWLLGSLLVIPAEEVGLCLVFFFTGRAIWDATWKNSRLDTTFVDATELGNPDSPLWIRGMTRVNASGEKGMQR